MLMEVSFQFHIYSNYVQLIKAALRHAAPFVKRTFFSLCSRHNSLYEAIRQGIWSSA